MSHGTHSYIRNWHTHLLKPRSYVAEIQRPIPNLLFLANVQILRQETLTITTTSMITESSTPIDNVLFEWGMDTWTVTKFRAKPTGDF